MNNELQSLLNSANFSMADKVTAIEQFGKSLPKVDLKDIDSVKGFAQADLPVSHYFSLGIYAKAVYIPKKTIAVGKYHKYPQLNILLQGRMSVRVSEDEIQTLKAPYIISSPAGTRRIVYAHEDSIWLTILGTDETDVDLIEKQFTAETEEEYLKFCEDNQLKLPLTVEEVAKNIVKMAEDEAKILDQHGIKI